MDLLILLTYFSVVWVVFKIFNIPVNKWSGTTVIIGAFVLLGTILGIMAYFHPSSLTARSMFVTTPVVPNVKGKVIEVNVQANVPLEKGDVLFKIDPTPYKATVNQLKAELKFAKKRLYQSKKLAKVSAGSQYEVQKYEKEVASLSAKMVQAEFDLDSTVIKAPTKGFVTHLRLRPGMMAVPFPLSPVMTFVHTDKPIFVAGFTQKSMQNIKVDNEIEIFFPGIPGRVFKGKVTSILSALAEGQLSPSATMIKINPIMRDGLIPVTIEITDDMSEFFLPMGSEATVAIYSERFHHVTIVRKILMRMASWRNFVKFH